MSAVIAPTTPVIIGVGHVTRRPEDLASTTEPAQLVAAAITAAAEDAGLTMEARYGVDTLEVVNLLSWRYADPVGVIGSAAGLAPRNRLFSLVGGDQPTRRLDAAARRIAAGDSELAVVAGGEAMRSRNLWRRAGQQPDWPAWASSPAPFDRYEGLGFGAYQHGLVEPTTVYPLVENAYRAARHTSLAEEQGRSARIWSALSAVAAHTPGAWTGAAVPADVISTPTPDNRLVAHPYTKLQCAQPGVDQSAALVIASAARATRLGIPESQWVHLWSAAGAADTIEVLERTTYASSPTLTRVLADALAGAELGVDGIDLFELYSCFPIVPKLALDALGLPDEHQTTVTGGLTFYGGPLNAYMLCASVNMVRALRAGRGRTGLLLGNGEFVTNHHAVVLSTEARSDGRYPADDRAAREADIHAGPTVAVTTSPEGAATVETSTVLYDREGGPRLGVVIGRLADGTRFVANTPGDDDSYAALTTDGPEPTGRPGKVHSTDGRNTFELI